MIVSTWNGGTDYGGCIGAGNGWNNSVINHHFATSTYQPKCGSTPTDRHLAQHLHGIAGTSRTVRPTR